MPIYGDNIFNEGWVIKSSKKTKEIKKQIKEICKELSVKGIDKLKQDPREHCSIKDFNTFNEKVSKLFDIYMNTNLCIMGGYDSEYWGIAITGIIDNILINSIIYAGENYLSLEKIEDIIIPDNINIDDIKDIINTISHIPNNYYSIFIKKSKNIIQIKDNHDRKCKERMNLLYNQIGLVYDPAALAVHDLIGSKR